MKKTLIFLLITLAAISAYSDNSSGSEIGRFLFLKIDDPYLVYVNNEFKGTTPLFLDFLPAGPLSLRLESENYYFTQDYIVNPSINEPVVLDPDMVPFTGEVSLAVDTPGAKVFFDGMELEGSGDFSHETIPGEYFVLVEAEGYFPGEFAVTVTRNEVTRLQVELDTVHEVTFSSALPEETVIICSKDDREVSFSEKDTLLLSAGEWNISVTNRLFSPFETTFSVGDDNQIAFKPVYYESYIEFDDLQPESVVYLDGEDITSSITGGKYKIAKGFYELAVVTPRFENYTEKLHVENDTTVTVSPEYTVSKATVRGANTTIGLIITGAGAAVAAGGYFLNQDSVIMAQTSNYEDYSTTKYVTLGFFVGGIVTAVGGGLFTFLANQ